METFYFQHMKKIAAVITVRHQESFNSTVYCIVLYICASVFVGASVKEHSRVEIL